MRGSVTSKCARGHRRSEGRCSSRCTRWYFVTEGPRTADGKRRRLWSRGFPTRKAADVALRAELSRRDQGIVLDHERLTLVAYAERWLAHMRSTREPVTVQRYEEILRLYILPTLGTRQLKSLQPLKVQIALRPAERVRTPRRCRRVASPHGRARPPGTAPGYEAGRSAGTWWPAMPPPTWSCPRCRTRPCHADR